jgi:hypothetical protein
LANIRDGNIHGKIKLNLNNGPYKLERADQFSTLKDNPFEQSTLATSTPGAMAQSSDSPPLVGQGVVLRPPLALRVLLPCILGLSSSGVVGGVFFTTPHTIPNLILALVLGLFELGMGAGFWVFYNGTFVWADDRGVSQKKWGKTQTIAWPDIKRIEWVRAPKGNLRYRLKDAAGNTLMDFLDFTDTTAGIRLRDFIKARIDSYET